MAAPTTTTLTTVKKQLVTLFKAALPDVQVAYAWPGPSTEPEAVFLGYHPELRDINLNATNDIPTIQTGRQQTREDYIVPVTSWTFRPELDASDAQECEERAEELFEACASTIADDAKLGLSADTVRWSKLGDWESTLWPFRSGWACSWVFEVDVSARLR